MLMLTAYVRTGGGAADVGVAPAAAAAPHHRPAAADDAATSGSARPPHRPAVAAPRRLLPACRLPALLSRAGRVVVLGVVVVGVVVFVVGVRN